MAEDWRIANVWHKFAGLGAPIALRNGFGNRCPGKVDVIGATQGGSVEVEISLMPESMATLESDQELMNVVSVANVQLFRSKMWACICFFHVFLIRSYQFFVQDVYFYFDWCCWYVLQLFYSILCMFPFVLFNICKFSLAVHVFWNCSV